MKLDNNLSEKVINCLQNCVLPYLRDPLFLAKWDSPTSRDKTDNRITAVLNTGYRKLIHRDNYKGDLFMFIQDMSNFIVPYRDSYKFYLKSRNKKKELLIMESIGKKNDWNLTDAVTNFVRRAGNSLFYYSEAFYEVKVTRNKQGQLKRFDLYDIYPPSMFKIFGRYFQFVTWEAAKSAQTMAGIRMVPKNSIVHIVFPKELGGKRRIRWIIRRLAKLGKVLIPDFHIKNLYPSKPTGFDFNIYRLEKYKEISQLTKDLGWNQRRYQDNEILEYYSIHRHLNFVCSQALVREKILNGLNVVIKKNVGSEVKCSGLLTSLEIKSEQLALLKGGLEFSKLFKRTSQ